MNLAKYEEITGITVPVNEQAIVEAQIKRTRKILEGMLGYPLNSQKISENLYNEDGKTAADCTCPANIDEDNLLDPDDVEFAYRTYSYNPKDQFLFVDPFTEVYAVKLIWNNITVKTFDADDWRVQMKNGWGKFIENCQRTLCFCDCNDCVQLAVDAQWLNACEMTDITYIWADMITYYANCKKDVKQESIGAHSYTKFDRDMKPQNEAENISVLRKYAGPNGSLTRTLIV